MASIFQGVAAPDVQTTRTTGTTAPQYYQDYLSGLAGAGTTALGKSPQELVAPMTEKQQAGLAAVPGAATAYKPGLAAAETTAGGVAAGLTPERIQALMSPYTTNVTDEMARLSQQNLQRNLLPSLKAAFVGTGGTGGQRMMGALGQMGADVQANLTGAQTGALQKGYSEALQAALNNMNLQNQAAQTQAKLAEQEQTLGLTGAEALTKAGAQEQAQQQALINAPLSTATNVANLMKGYQVPVTTTESFKGPIAGVYGVSPLSQVTGLGTLIGSSIAETTQPVWDPTTQKYVTKTTPGWGTSLWNKVFGGSGSGTATGTGGSTTVPTEQANSDAFANQFSQYLNPNTNLDTSGQVYDDFGSEFGP